MKKLIEKIRKRFIHWYYYSAENKAFFKHAEYEQKSPVVIRCGVDFSAVEGSRARFGKRAMLNSDSHRYPHFMHSKVKIRLLRADSVLTVGERTRIHGSCITCYESVTIGDRCLISANTQIMDAGGHRISGDDVSKRIGNIGFDTKPVEIGNDVWIGLNCIILPGSKIGNGSVIAAGSVVSGIIPEMVIAGGMPAKVIRTIVSES
jgi:acetyltransferase-like isoleucine patch superfamily enzyme